MSTPLHILVTDVNHHVRDLLKREFQKEGYTVYLAKNGDEAQRVLSGPDPLDFVVLDPELPGESGSLLLRLIQDASPRVQIIVHTYPEFAGTLKPCPNVCFVEKSAASIGPIKEVIRRLSVK
ncbi:MAG: response regulator [Pseudomonadota bacterium]